MEKINFKLFSNFIILSMVKKTTLSLVVPETVDKAGNGTYYDLIVASVSDEKDETGRPLVANVKVGDKVLLNPYSTPMKAEFDKKEYLICREAELIGIFTDDKKEVLN
ncbi:MAG: co-chaperone GroES family protein [Candidatus Amoebophilus sp.]